MIKTIHSVEYASLLLLLRQKRLDAGITQVELSRQLGVPHSFVGKIERGERRIDVIELQTFCRVFGIELQEFIAELQKRQRTGR